MKQVIRVVVFAVIAITLAACNTTRVTPSEHYPANANWLLLPLVNYSQTPQAGQKAERILASLLHQKGVQRLHEYPALDNVDSLLSVDDRVRFDQAASWAKDKNYQFWISGSVEEWRYKSGLDGEPAVGITLRLIEPNSEQVIWTVTGAKTGWGQQSVASVANELLTELLSGLLLE